MSTLDPRPSTLDPLFKLSEFYDLRRNAITDLSAFFGFLIGFLGSAPFAWPFLQVGFQTSEIVKGFTWFIVITFGAGVVLGVVGLGVGRALGSLWEGSHRVMRRAKGGELPLEYVREPTGTTPPRMPVVVSESPSVTPANIRYAPDVSAVDVIVLARHSGVEPPAEAPLGESLKRTTNIGAYDGDRLVGLLRMLTDGFEWTVVTDFLVDPAYRRQGIGSALMRRAGNQATGRLAVAQIPPGTEGFFRRLEVIPAYEGFVRGAKSRLQ